MVYFGQYSPRPETAAWKMKDDVSKQEKVNREKLLNNILAQTTFGNNKKYVGKIIEVLIDNKKNGYYFGHTRTMKNVKVVSNRKNLVGKIIKVKITKANIWNLEACLLIK
jgi:tRNA A37 methylthiotransferase MiaB